MPDGPLAEYWRLESERLRIEKEGLASAAIMSGECVLT